MQLVLCFVVGLFGGQWLDEKAGTTPALTLLGTVLGLVAGFRSLYVAAKQAERELSETPPEPEPGPRVFGPVPWETQDEEGDSWDKKDEEHEEHEEHEENKKDETKGSDR
jgi:uncharacterized protein YneF (UPF0154 family)